MMKNLNLESVSDNFGWKFNNVIMIILLPYWAIFSLVSFPSVSLKKSVVSLFFFLFADCIISFPSFPLVILLHLIFSSLYLLLFSFLIVYMLCE